MYQQHKYKVFVYLSNTKDRFQRSHSLKVKNIVKLCQDTTYTLLLVSFLHAMLVGDGQ